MGPYQGIKEHNLKDYEATDEDLRSAWNTFTVYGEDYVSLAIMAWGYEKYLLTDDDFTFLFTRKHIHQMPEQTPLQQAYRSDLIQGLIKGLEQWTKGEEVTPTHTERQTWVNDPGSVRERYSRNKTTTNQNGHRQIRRPPTRKEVQRENERKRQARERFYADLKAKRQGGGSKKAS